MNPDRGHVLRWILVVSTAYVLQIGVLVDVSIFGVHPELMLLVGLCAGVAGGPARGAEVGFVAGLLADLVLTGPLGVTALAYAIAGFAAGVLADAVMHSSRAITIAIVGATSVGGVLVYAAAGQLLGERTLSDPRLLQIVGIVSVCNAVLSLPILALSRWAEGSAVRTGVA